MEPTRISKETAAGVTGISRMTISRWAKKGEISEDANGRVVVAEVRENWKKPITGKVHDKNYAFSRASSRPGKAPSIRRVYRAPVREIDEAAAMEDGGEEIDFRRVKGTYDLLRVWGDEFFVGIRSGKYGYHYRLELVVKRQKILRGVAIKKIRNQRITNSDRVRVAAILRRPGAGLGNLGFPTIRDVQLFVMRHEDEKDELVAEVMEKHKMSWADLLNKEPIRLGDPDPMSSFSPFWKIVLCAPDLVCHKIFLSYAKAVLMNLELDDVTDFQRVAAELGISRQAVIKRFMRGVNRINDKKLGEELKAFQRDPRGAIPTALIPENDATKAFDRESQGSLKKRTRDF